MMGKDPLARVVILLLLLASGVSSGVPAKETKTVHPIQGGLTEAVFTEMERRIICDYYQIPACGSRSLLDQVPKDQRKKLKDQAGSKGKSAVPPPGLAKHEAFPPGLERQYQLNGTLPPGLQKRQFPDELARALPQRGGQYERVIAGNDILLVAVATGIIVDILEGVAAER